MRREAGRFFPRADPGKLIVRGSWSFIFVFDLFVAGAGVRDFWLGVFLR